MEQPRRWHAGKERKPTRYSPDIERLRRRNRMLILLALILMIGLALLDWHSRDTQQIGNLLVQVEDNFLSISGAIHRYRIDTGRTGFQNAGLFPAGKLYWLTTPQDYLWPENILEDPFGTGEYQVLIPETTAPLYYLISAGPDHQPDVSGPLVSSWISGGTSGLEPYLSPLRYDPSNGIHSPGDIIWNPEKPLILNAP
jgi:hypothetical protein